jgi:hypothetical protein
MNQITHRKHYLQEAIQAINYIKERFGFSEFTYNQVIQHFIDNKINGIVLYNLKIAKLLIQKERGVYRVSADVNLFSDNTIAEMIRIAVRDNNAKKKSVIKLRSLNSTKEIKKKTIFDTPAITEKSAIEFLKAKGYKILKPVAQFEEV